MSDSGWTIETLKELMEREFAARDAALKLAYSVIDARLVALNHLRDEVVKDRSNYLRVDVYEQRHQALESLIADVHDRQTAIENRQNGFDAARSRLYAAIGAAVGLITIGLVLADHFFK